MEQSSSQPEPRQRRCLACEQPITDDQSFIHWPAVRDDQAHRYAYRAAYHPDCVPPAIQSYHREAAAVFAAYQAQP